MTTYLTLNFFIVLSRFSYVDHPPSIDRFRFELCEVTKDERINRLIRSFKSVTQTLSCVSVIRLDDIKEFQSVWFFSIDKNSLPPYPRLSTPSIICSHQRFRSDEPKFRVLIVNDRPTVTPFEEVEGYESRGVNTLSLLLLLLS